MARRERKGELTETLMWEARKLATRQVLMDQAVGQRLGLGSTDMQCLGVLDLAGPLTAGRMAALTGLTTGAVTGVVDRLEKAGYARRAPDPRRPKEGGHQLGAAAPREGRRHVRRGARAPA